MAQVKSLLGINHGPFGPMGAGVDIGAPLDYTRPLLGNDDDSFSTERTITVSLNGRWYNVPTIVNGKELPAAEVEQYFSMGLLPHVGEFETKDRAIRSAIVRSEYIGTKRGGEK